MSNPLTVTELLERNKAVAASHEPAPFFSEFASRGMDKPHILVLTCADPRCSPEYYLNLKPNEGVLVLRNLCGHAANSLNDVVTLDRLVTLRDMLVIHHSDCGGLYFKDDQIRGVLKERVGDDAAIDNMNFGGITNVEQSVKDDVAILKSSKYIRKELADHIKGYVYDVKTGELSPVEA